MLKEVVVFCAVLSVSFSAMSYGPLEEKPEKFKNVEGCYISKLDAVIPFGGKAPSKTKCMEYRCGKDRVQRASCGLAIATPPCVLVEDKTKPYPDCCPKPSCPPGSKL